jgi:hypothetical protein
MTMSLLMNNTSNNRATHCIYAWAWLPAFLVAEHNIMLFGPGGTPAARCGEFFSTDN